MEDLHSIACNAVGKMASECHNINVVSEQSHGKSVHLLSADEVVLPAVHLDALINTLDSSIPEGRIEVFVSTHAKQGGLKISLHKNLVPVIDTKKGTGHAAMHNLRTMCNWRDERMVVHAAVESTSDSGTETHHIHFASELEVDVRNTRMLAAELWPEAAFSVSRLNDSSFLRPVLMVRAPRSKVAKVEDKVGEDANARKRKRATESAPPFLKRIFSPLRKT